MISKYITGVTGLDVTEIAALAVLDDESRRSGGGHVKNSRVVDRLEMEFGYAPRITYEFLQDAAHQWSTSIPLVDFHGNGGGYGYPAAPASVTEARPTAIGRFISVIEEEGRGAVPLRLIDGTICRGGTMPSFPARQMLQAIEAIMNGTSLSDEELMRCIGLPLFWNSPAQHGNLAELYAGEYVVWELAPSVGIVSDGDSNFVQMTNLPPGVWPDTIAAELDELRFDGSLDAALAGVSQVEDLSHGAEPADIRLRFHLDNGVSIEAVANSLVNHRIGWDELNLKLPEPMKVLLEEWVQVHASVETRRVMSEFEKLLAP